MSIKEIKQIVKDKPQGEWTAEEWNKVSNIVGFTDKQCFYSIPTINSRIANMAGNEIIEGDWEDYNRIASDDSYDLQNICNCAFSLIDEWIDSDCSNVTIPKFNEILENIKTFEKENELSVELHSRLLNEYISFYDDFDELRETFATKIPDGILEFEGTCLMIQGHKFMLIDTALADWNLFNDDDEMLGIDEVLHELPARQIFKIIGDEYSWTGNMN